MAYEAFGVFPTLLERDFNIPPVKELLEEVELIALMQDKWQDHAGSFQQNSIERKQA
jgi:uncharacterized protein (UPF0276 family)